MIHSFLQKSKGLGSDPDPLNTHAHIDSTLMHVVLTFGLNITGGIKNQEVLQFVKEYFIGHVDLYRSKKGYKYVFHCLKSSGTIR